MKELQFPVDFLPNVGTWETELIRPDLSEPGRSENYRAVYRYPEGDLYRCSWMPFDQFVDFVSGCIANGVIITAIEQIIADPTPELRAYKGVSAFDKYLMENKND